tara:strand:+ start:3156 stop:3764 length:609 start_codon:yes stop_codon:yes gene_type:complete
MSFRTENKFILSKNKKFLFKQWLIKNDYSELYPKRSINSVYLDTKNFMIYKDSIEGIIPRKKIRLRTYANNFFYENNKFNYEIKISSAEGRYKKQKIYDQEINKIFKGIYDNQYGICYPVLNVVYDREYYIKNKSRITIDTNIKYFNINGKRISKYPFNEECFIVENKTKDLNQNEMLDFFIFENKRFSKYCNGIEQIKKII